MKNFVSGYPETTLKNDANPLRITRSDQNTRILNLGYQQSLIMPELSIFTCLYNNVIYTVCPKSSDPFLYTYLLYKILYQDFLDKTVFSSEILPFNVPKRKLKTLMEN